MSGNFYQQPSGGQGFPQEPNGFFQSDRFQQYSNAYNQGEPYDSVSHDDVYNDYQQFARQASPQQVYDAHHQYYQQVPQQQRQGLLGGLMNAFQQHGVNPQQVGFNPNDPSPENLARGSQYASQNPDILSQAFGPGGALNSPVAKAALIGGLIFAGNRILGK